MGSRDRNGYLTEEAVDCDVGLGLKMQNQNQQDDGGGGFGSFAAMMGNSTAYQSQVATTPSPPTYDVFLTPQASAAAAAAASYTSLVDQQRPSYSHPPSLKSTLGGGLGLDTGARVPSPLFTASQRQELERQTIIYKLITASVPVPSDLVLPKSNFIFPATHHHINGGRNSNSSTTSSELLRCGSNRIGGSRNTNGDAEPWRCRRTDGKKWRCSRDVAPDQKYCERHSHKGRPSRSRKHVESSSLSTTRSLSNPSSRNDVASATVSSADKITTTCTSSASPSSFNFIKSPIYDNRQKTTSFLDQNTSSMVLPQQMQYHNYHYNNTSRFPEWYMEKEGHHHNTHIDDAVTMIAPPPTYLHQMGPQSADHPVSRHAAIHQTSCPLPRQFLDDWSSQENGGRHSGTIKPNNMLTLSMGGIESCNGDEDPAPLGIGLVVESEGRGGSNEYSWMSPSQPGGPLAEALCLGIAGGSASSSGPTPTSSSCSR